MTHQNAQEPETNFPCCECCNRLSHFYQSLTPQEVNEFSNQLTAGGATKFVFKPYQEISPEVQEILDEFESKWLRNVND